MRERWDKDEREMRESWWELRETERVLKEKWETAVRAESCQRAKSKRKLRGSWDLILTWTWTWPYQIRLNKTKYFRLRLTDEVSSDRPKREIWDWPGTDLALTWHWPGTDLGQTWDRPETDLRLTWDWPETDLRLTWDRQSDSLGSFTEPKS